MSATRFPASYRFLTRNSVVFLSFALLMCGCERMSGTTPRHPAFGNPLGEQEDSIKLKQMSELHNATLTDSKTLITQLEIKVPGFPTAVIPRGPHNMYVLDNDSGQVFDVAYSGSTVTHISPIALPSRLDHPIMMRSTGRSLSFLDGPNLLTADLIKNRFDVVHHMYTGNDFILLGNSRIALNPILRPHGVQPLVIEIAANGIAGSKLGSQDTVSFAGLEGRADLALCNSSVVAALRYEPELYIFPPHNARGIRVHLPVPGEAELDELTNHKDLVNPRPDVYVLPRFLAGVSCQAGAIFVLADLPTPYVYKLTATGKLLDVYRGTSVYSGRHFSRLSTAVYNRCLYFYTIATDPEGPLKIVVIRGG